MGGRERGRGRKYDEGQAEGDVNQTHSEELVGVYQVGMERLVLTLLSSHGKGDVAP